MLAGNILKNVSGKMFQNVPTVEIPRKYTGIKTENFLDAQKLVSVIIP